MSDATSATLEQARGRVTKKELAVTDLHALKTALI